MGPKRWQLQELEKALKLEQYKVKRLLEVVDKYIEYFSQLPKDANDLKRIKTAIQNMEKENEQTLRSL